MKFLHTADIHLDSPLTGLSAYPDAPAALLRTATRDAFAQLVSEALAQAVDFVVIAGDLYDGGWRDFNTGLFFAAQMGRLGAAGIPVYWLLGNHDAENEMTRKLVLPANVHRFSASKAETFRLPQHQVALHGRSFKDPKTQDNLALTYPAPVAGWLNIGVLHTALEGQTAHARYAPCAMAELQARGYQYWALGHVHEQQIWHGGSAAAGGTATVAYCGNLQGRHVRETGPRGALLVTAEGDRITAVEPLTLDVLRWHALAVDVAPAATLTDAVRLTGQALQTLLASQDHALPLAVRVTLTGASAAHGELFGLEAQLRAEVLAQAAGLGHERLWIEKVVVATQPPPVPADRALQAGALADLQALLAQAGDDPGFMDALQADLLTLIGRLPVELVHGLPELDAVLRGEMRPLVADTGAALVAQLAHPAHPARQA